MLNSVMYRVIANKKAKGFPLEDYDYDINKIKEEVEELVKAIAADDKNEIGEELADIIIMCLGIAGYKKLNMEIHLLVKMDRIEKRKITNLGNNRFAKQEGE